ncbi:hypothetical protein E0485_18275 [Paenibacillus albiflavus]|uniref:DUF4064 domain-containing protein n=1 Tax=Paenibacillus albiflavus TaxID=2545760 RepID=A0A4V2WNG5_9BACL|nr:hypothetical protein [Paenibacillus albiflavus]TCZ75332.1 hypothetical protein E0485_18275 [Paenibacillus albiflavus]
MFATGLISGILGIASAIIALFFSGFAATLGVEGAGDVVWLGWLAFGVSILGIIGAAIARSKPKLAGFFMVVAGVVGFVAISWLYVISTVLFVIAGLVGLFSKK